MKQVEYLGRIYDIKEDTVEIGMNSFYQIFTKNNKCEYTFIELRGDLIGKINGLPQTVTIVSKEPKPHPHADLILKYAMISQYDDKPWENFEYLASDGEWVTKNEGSPFCGHRNYRLKPQESKIKAGQIWVDKLGVIVSIRKYRAGIVFIDITAGGLVIPWSFRGDYFLQNFKLKENK